jgi:hypothetical protein
MEKKTPDKRKDDHVQIPQTQAQSEWREAAKVGNVVDLMAEVVEAINSGVPNACGTFTNTRKIFVRINWNTCRVVLSAASPYFSTILAPQMLNSG